MSNFVVYMLLFGLGALWMKLKCIRMYESDVWKAKHDLKVEKIRLQAEKVRLKVSKLLDEQIGEKA